MDRPFSGADEHRTVLRVAHGYAMKGGDARIIKDNRFHTVHGEYVEQQVFVIEYIEAHILYCFLWHVGRQTNLQGMPLKQSSVFSAMHPDNSSSVNR